MNTFEIRASALRIFLFLFAASFVLWSIPGFCQDRLTKEDEMELVFFNPDSASQNPIDATNALQTFCNVLQKREGWNLRAYFFKKQKDLDNFLDTRKVEFGILSQVYLVENHKKRNFVPFVSPVRDGLTTYRKVVIITKASGYKDLMDLQGKTLAATSLGEENVPFYNKIIFRDEIDVTTHFKEIKPVDSANSAIMAVLYGQVDAATVTLTSFTIMQDLNPQVKQKLTSIYTSAETPISPMVYFADNLDMSLLPKFKKILLELHNDPIGRQSMLAFQVEAWEPCSMDEFIETENILTSSAVLAPTAKPTPRPVVPDEKVEPTPVPEKEGPPEITRTQVFKSEDGKQLVFNAWVVQAKPGVDTNAVLLYYSLDGSSETSIRLSSLGKDKFTASIPFAGTTSGQATSQEIEYVVKSGDTLGKIATKLLGSSKKYMLIATMNNITDPNIIQVNQKLKIRVGEEKVTEVKFSVSARDMNGNHVRSQTRSQFIL